MQIHSVSHNSVFHNQATSTSNVTDIVNLESDLSSASSQMSLDAIPDFSNCSFGTLCELAGLSNYDNLIYGNE